LTLTQIAPFPGTGMDRRTGKLLTGWQHVLQSLDVIFTTHFGQRVMRRWFGSFVPKILGENMTPSTVLRFWTAICIAIDTWEPRYRVIRIVPRGSSDQMLKGALGFEIEGVYMPRGHLGDFTPEQDIRSVRLGGNASGLRVLSGASQ
jgi:phage baseplate assembly protein W